MTLAPARPRVLTICGSLQRVSTNRWLLDAFAEIARSRIDCQPAPALDAIAAFDPDLVDDASENVTELRTAIARADAVVIATPEYAASFPGMLKNALDWLVGSGELYGKPVAVLSAGTTGGLHVLPAMVQTLGFQGANVVTVFGIDAPRAKFDVAGSLIDEATIASLDGVVDALVSAVQQAKP